MIKIQTVMPRRWQYVGIWIGASVIFWISFKFYYPHVSIVFDSYYYINAAFNHANVSVWPIGYSKFLQFIGLFSHSVNTLVISQYLFLQSALLLFFFAMRYFLALGKWASMALFGLLLMNPIYIYTCNFVLSDGLFMGVSLLWFCNLFSIIFWPKHWMIISQAILLFLAFAIRHSALVYPFITCLAFLLSRQKTWLKIAGIALPCIFVGGFILYTTNLNNSLYGVRQFSPFQGWKVANNALYMYEYVPADELETVPEKFQPLDSLVRSYFRSDHYKVGVLHMGMDPSMGCFYMLNFPSPLLVYRDMQYGHEPYFLINVRTLSKLGPLYSAYGTYIIKKYPFTYLNNFVLPNVLIYLMPFPEVYMGNRLSYTLKSDTLGVVAKKWFEDNNLSLSAPTRSVNFRTTLFYEYPMVNMVTHCLFILSVLGFFFLIGPQKTEREVMSCIWLILMLWLSDFFFIVIAAASVLRFQLFITAVEIGFILFFAKEFYYLANFQMRSTSTIPRQKATKSGNTW